MKIQLLICDLDNTLYDWVSYFVTSFYAMADKASEILECDYNELLNDFRSVHQKYHDVERPFSLLDTATVKNKLPKLSRGERARYLDDAFKAFNSARKRSLRLHPGVRSALEAVEGSGVKLVAHTDSGLLAAVDRLRRLDVYEFFSHIYCRERGRSTHPNPDRASIWFDNLNLNHVRELSHHQRKPDETVIWEICQDQGFSKPETAYIGDSIAKDVLMARKAGVSAIWAKYGAQHDEAEYQKLVRISHWTDKDVQYELQLTDQAAHVRPDFVAEQSFDEVMDFIEITNHEPSSVGRY